MVLQKPITQYDFAKNLATLFTVGTGSICFCCSEKNVQVVLQKSSFGDNHKGFSSWLQLSPTVPQTSENSQCHLVALKLTTLCLLPLRSSLF